MKRIILGAILLTAAYAAYAQTPVRNTGTLHVNSGTTFFVRGTLSNNGTISNGGTIQVAGDFNTQTGTYTRASANDIVHMAADGSSFTTLFFGGNTMGEFVANNPLGVVIATEALIATRLRFLGGRIRTVGAGELVLLPSMTNTDIIGANSTNYIVGQMRVQRNAGTDPIFYPLGTASFYRPFTINGYTAPTGLVDLRLEVIASDPAATVVPGSKFVRPSKAYYYQLQNLGTNALVSNASSTFTVEWDANDNLSYSSVSNVRVGYTGLGITGPYSLANRVSQSGAGPYILVSSLPGNINTGGSVYNLITGIGKVEAGTLASSSGTTIAPSDTADLVVSGASTPSPAMVWNTVTGTAPAFTYTPVSNQPAIPGLAYTTHPLFTETNYAVVASELDFESDTTNTVALSLADHILLQLSVHLEGPSSSPGVRTMNAYPSKPHLFNYYSTPANVPPGLAYTGTTVPDNVVDAVEIELRNGNALTAGTVASDPTTYVVARKMGWLLQNGTVVEYLSPDPVAPVSGIRIPTGGGVTGGGRYFVVVKHRNHLPIMSRNSLTFPLATGTAIDLSVPGNVYSQPGFFDAGGRLDLTNASSPIIRMYAGNVDAAQVRTSGVSVYSFISARDYNRTTIKSALGAPVLALDNFDINLDGAVSAADETRVQTNSDVTAISSVSTGN